MRRAMWGGWIVFFIIVILILLFVALRYRWLVWRF